MNTRKTRRPRGFTLMEVLLVLAILVILSSLAVVGYQQIQKGAYQNAAKVQIGIYDEAAGLYQLDVGHYPTSLDDLVSQPADVPEGKWKGPYIKGQLMRDPWGQAYEYEVLDDGNGNQSVRIRSNGPNRIQGDADDVANI